METSPNRNIQNDHYCTTYLKIPNLASSSPISLSDKNASYLDGAVDLINEPLAREVAHGPRQQEEAPRQDEGVTEEETRRNPLPITVPRACNPNSGRRRIMEGRGYTVQHARGDAKEGQGCLKTMHSHSTRMPSDGERQQDATGSPEIM